MMLLFERSMEFNAEPGDNECLWEGMSPWMAALLRARGMKSAEEMYAFLYPQIDDLCDPMLLPDMDKAKARIELALERGESICIYGDYDVDGMCSVAILLKYLRARGGNVSFFIPSRMDDGYGMSEGTIRGIEQSGAKLIITVDNGIKAVNEIRLCYKLGMEVIVTDHHLCGAELPVCEAVVCHNVESSKYPNKNICGAGVALKLVHAMGGMKAMMEYLPLAGIATVADVVPLLGENRAIVAFAVRMISDGECSIGISTLMELSTNSKRIPYIASDISFGFAPRLNAAGRMEDAGIGVELLCTDSQIEAIAISEKLNELNRLRQAEEAEICRQADAMVAKLDLSNTRCIVLKSDEWHKGVIGIAASRIAEKYYRPTVLFSEHDGILTGSARSIPFIDIYSMLSLIESRFIRFGGHSFAAGITMKASEIDEMRTELEAVLTERIAKDVYTPRKFYEVEAPLRAMSVHLVDEVELLAPFGVSNPMPLFLTRGVAVSQMRRMGREGMHLSMMLHQDNAVFRGVAFSKGALFDELIEAERINILYTPMRDNYNGGDNVQLRISAIQKAAVRDADAYSMGHENDFYNALLNNILYNSFKGDVQCTFIPNAELEAFRLLESEISGTVVLCFTCGGTGMFLHHLNEHGMADRVDVRLSAMPEAPCPYHAAVFAPELDRLSISRYKNIIVYDTPFSIGVLAKLHELAPDAKLYVQSGVCEEAIEMARRLNIGRDGIIPYYREIMNAGIRFYNKTEIIRRVLNKMGGIGFECRMALNICLELGFLKQEPAGGISIADTSVKRSLNESPTFIEVEALEGRLAEIDELMNESEVGTVG